MQAVLAALKKLGVADKDIQTRNFSVSAPICQRQRPSAAHHRLSGEQQVEVRLADIGKLGPAWTRW